MLLLVQVGVHSKQRPCSHNELVVLLELDLENARGRSTNTFSLEGRHGVHVLNVLSRKRKSDSAAHLPIGSNDVGHSEFDDDVDIARRIGHELHVMKRAATQSFQITCARHHGTDLRAHIIAEPLNTLESLKIRKGFVLIAVN